MVEEKVEPREAGWGARMPVAYLFQGFRIALDLNKIILAAGGILSMAQVWWRLAIIFLRSEPDLNKYPKDANDPKDTAWLDFKKAYERWNLNFQAAAPADEVRHIGPADLANTRAEYELLVN